MKHKNLFLLTILVLFNFSCAFNYKFTITNLTDKEFKITMPTKTAKKIGSGAAIAFMVIPISGSMFSTVLTSLCLAQYKNFELKVSPFSKKFFDTVHCCFPSFNAHPTSEKNTTLDAIFDNGTGCKGADIYIHRTATGFEMNTKSTLQETDLKYAVVQAATKEAAEMDAQAKSGNIKLKFMPLKHISVEVQDSLRKQNADAKAANKDKNGIFHIYIQTIPAFSSIKPAELETAEDMVTAGLLEDKNKSEETPLYLAIKEGRRDWVLFLVRHKADVFAKDSSNKNSLHHAAENGDAYMIQLLIKAAQMILDEKLKSNKINGLEYTKIMYDFINSKDDFGNTPFDYASDVEAARIFLDPKRTANIQAKADINKLDSRGSTKLINAILSGKDGADVLDALIKYPGIDLRKENAKGETPILMAVATNKNFVGKRLPGASPFITEKLSVQTSLEKLLRAGLNPKDAVDKEGNNLLHIASVFGDINSFQKIVNRVSPEDLFIKNKKGQNALHLATLAHNRDAVEYLYRLNPKLLQEKDDRGKIPLDYAIQEGFKDLVEFLKKPGAIMPAPYETDKEKRLREEQSKAKN